MNKVEQEIYNCSDGSDRLCDFCSESKALLYCRADSAKLCFSCDRQVHATNPLFRKHSRSLLCDSCNSSPSSIFCSTESSVLCQNCDWETHNHFGSIHDRRPVEGFIGCPSVSELLGILGLQDLGKKNLDLSGGKDEGFSDMLVWETPSVVSLDDLIVANDCDDSSPAFQAMGVPPLPKNRNASCGKYKEEIFFQLHEMAKEDPNYNGSLEDFEEQNEVQPQVPTNLLRDTSPGLDIKLQPVKVAPSCEDSNIDWCFSGGIQDEGFPRAYFGDFSHEMNHLVPDKDADAGDSSGITNGFQSCVPVDSMTFQLLPTAGHRELNSQERDSALSRYKEKKKTRRYDKHVRYESRKVRAESRMRIKGRFAKKDH